MNVSLEALQSFCVAALQAEGMPEREAALTAEALALTDAMGVFTHGTKLLAGYLNRLHGGGYRATATPYIRREGPAWAVVDGESALGQIGGMFSIRTAIKKARQCGVAYVGLVNTGHIGAAGYYAAVAAHEGFVAMITGNDMPSVAAPGSRGPVLGSNPLAYGVPVPDGDPILLDMATAAVAGGKVYAAHTRGEPLPSTWLIDRAGLPTTDGSLYPHNAALAPMAGHKGYGLGLWCEVLSGLIPGGKLTWEIGSWIFDEPSKPSLHNAGFILLDVAAMSPLDEFQTRIQKLIDEIHSTPTADGIERVLLPGEREWANVRRARTEGISLPMDVVEKLQLAAKQTGVACDWLTVPNGVV